MESQDLAKMLFENTEVRILGTAERPLFVAVDIARILSIKNPRDVLAKFDVYERESVNIVDSMGRARSTTLLTEAGLYALIIKSRKPIAREFKKWMFTEVLPSLRKTGEYRLNQNINELHTTLKLKRKLAKRDKEIATLKAGYKPKITYHSYDINEFTDEPCVYLIQLTDTEFKFGISGEIDQRSSTHFTKFRALGLSPKIIKLWKCKTMKIMKDTEAKIKLFARHNNILAPKYGHKEIISTDDLELIVKNITKYVDEQNSHDVRSMSIREKELDIELRKLDNENLRLQITLQRPISRLDARYDSTDVDNIDTVSIDSQSAQIEQDAIPNMSPDSESTDRKVIVYDTAVNTALLIEQPLIEQPLTEQPIIEQPIIAAPIDRKQIAQNWIAANPPIDREHTTTYYNRYKGAVENPLADSRFGPVVTGCGYTTGKSNGKRYWRLPNK
jgi:prophage antirepressor-like protein